MQSKPFVYPENPPSAERIRAMFRELFTEQERYYTSDLIQRGHIDAVGAALYVENPERAYWLEKYLDLKRPKAEVLDSKVREELRGWEGKNGPISSPALAAMWQSRLDAEKEGKELPPLEEALKVIADKSEPKEETKEETTEEAKEETMGEGKLSKKEIIEQLKAKGVEYDPAIKKSDSVK